MAEPNDPNALETARRWFNQNVGGSMSHVNEDLATKMAGTEFLHMTKSDAQKAVPVMAAAATGVAGIVFMPGLRSLGKTMMGGVKQVVTGFGYLPKIPLVGGLFNGAGKAVDSVSDYAGLALTAATGFMAYQALQPKVAGPSYDASALADAGTGTRGQEPENDRFTVTPVKGVAMVATEVGPVQPAKVASNATVEQLKVNTPALVNVPQSGLREQRASYLADNFKKDADAIGELMLEENQKYANRVTFLKRVESFAVTPSKGSTKSPRVTLVDALQDQRVGLTQPEAEALVPKPPALRYTVTHGATAKDNSLDALGKPTDFGGAYSKLVDFAEKFEGFYGVGYLPASQRNAAGKADKSFLKFGEMEPTQQHEFLQAALEHCRVRHEFFEKNCTTYSEYRKRKVKVTTANYDYRPLDKRGYLDMLASESSEIYRDEHGAARERTWREEHEFLRTLNKDSSVAVKAEAYGAKINESNQGTGLSKSRGAFGNWQKLMDAHREELKKAELEYGGAIRTYSEKIRFMKHSMNAIGQHGVAFLDYHKYKERSAEDHPDFSTRHFIDIRDLRRRENGASASDAERVRLEGSWDAPNDPTSFTFTVRAISHSGDGANKKMLATPIRINLETGEGVEALMQTIDQMGGGLVLHAGRELPPTLLEQARAAGAGVALPVSEAGRVSSGLYAQANQNAAGREADGETPSFA